MRYGILFIIVILFSGFSQSEIEWEKKYHSMKEERDMYRKTSEMLLKNWKECEEKVTKIISEQVN